MPMMVAAAHLIAAASALCKGGGDDYLDPHDEDGSGCRCAVASCGKDIAHAHHQ